MFKRFERLNKRLSDGGAVERTDGRADGRTGGRTDGQTDGRADRRTGGRTDGRTTVGRTDARSDGPALTRTNPTLPRSSHQQTIPKHLLHTQNTEHKSTEICNNYTTNIEHAWYYNSITTAMHCNFTVLGQFRRLCRSRQVSVSRIGIEQNPKYGVDVNL